MSAGNGPLPPSLYMDNGSPRWEPPCWWKPSTWDNEPTHARLERAILQLMDRDSTIEILEFTNGKLKAENRMLQDRIIALEVLVKT